MDGYARLFSKSSAANMVKLRAVVSSFARSECISFFSYLLSAGLSGYLVYFVNMDSGSCGLCKRKYFYVCEHILAKELLARDGNFL
jgi:hypothetical protein